jgi:hypothetical protein
VAARSARNLQSEICDLKLSEAWSILPSTFPECCRRRAGSVTGDKKRGEIVPVKAGPNLAHLR